MKNHQSLLKSTASITDITFQARKNSFKLIFSFAFLLFSIAGYATNYYVSTSGNDSNSGTSSDSPWKTLSKVNSFTFKPGDQILFKKGDQWTGTLTVTAGGTSGSPVVYGAYGTGAKPKIYGSDKITNWTQHSGNIYKASVSKAVYQVFVNDEKIKVSRYPNSGYFSVTSVNSSTSFSSSDLSSGINYTGASWFGRTGYYFNPTHKVTSSSGSSISLDAVPQKDLNVGEGFVLMNKLAFIDQAGEWAYDAGSKTVYLWLPKGDSPANYDVRVSVHDRGIYASGKNYVTVQGLEILQQAGKGIEIYNCDNWTIDGNDFSYPDGYAIMEESYGENHTITNNKVIGPNHIGFQLRTNNSRIADNVITDVGLYDNLGYTGNGKYYYGSAIFVGGKNNIIRHNRIIDINYNGIFFAGPNNLIEYNFVENTCLMKGDGGGIYTTQPGTNPTTGSVVRYNIVLNTVGSNQGYTSKVQFGDGIYIDESAHGVTVEYNTVYKSSNAGIKLHKCDANIVRYNTVMDSRYAIHVLNHSGSTKTQINNNILYSTGNGDVNKYEPRQLMIRTSSPNAVINNNFYRNPYESTGIFRSDSYIGFSEWKSSTGFDSNSTCNHSKLNTGEKEQLFYNNTKADKTISLGGKVYKDLDGKQITGSFVLKPFTSRILISTDGQAVADDNQKPVILNQQVEFLAPKKVNDQIGQVVANDPDAGQELTYKIIGGNEEGLFQLSTTTGNLFAKAEIPASMSKTVNLQVQVTDNAATPLSSSAVVTVTVKPGESAPVADVTVPVISSFSIPSSASTLTVPVTLAASDNIAVAGYKLTETSSAPNAGDGGWTTSAPVEYTFSAAGTKTLYAWVKDAAGNISASASKSVTIALADDNTTTPADSVEYVSICEGESYQGWTESGIYRRELTSESTTETAGANQILNGDFSNGTTNWSSWNASGYGVSISASSSEYNTAASGLQVACTANGTSISSIQVMNKAGIKLVAGKVYTLTFYAKASVQFAVGNIYIHKGTSPYTNYGSFDTSKPVIKTSWAKYQLKFTASQSASDGSFRIYLGNSLPAGQKVYFDDFHFSEYTQQAVTTKKIVETHLTVNSAKSSTEDVAITEGENYLGWTTSGVYTRTLETAAGCDSTVTTNLTVTAEKASPQIQYENEYVSICEGENYNGWTESGTYETLIPSPTGGSIMKVTHLTVEETKYSSESIKIWAGENYNGWTNSGYYERVLVSATGCDSIVVTRLMVRGKVSAPLGNTVELNPPVVSKENKVKEFGLEGEEMLFRLYPNPAQTYINVEYPSQPELDTRIEVVDGSGRIIHTQEASALTNRVDFNQLNPGMYYLRSVNKQRQHIEKFLIK